MRTSRRSGSRLFGTERGYVDPRSSPFERTAIPAFIGLDLAWSERNPSGGAAIDETGRVLEARADLGGDEEILAFVRAHLAETSVLGLDMPTIVPNPVGMRRCERELARDFRAYHAAPHPSNRARFPDGGRARALLDALAPEGVVERLDLSPRTQGRYAFEVFPHPAHVRLFARDSIFRYKKKPGRTWPEVWRGWAEYRAALAGLGDAEPPLHVPESVPLGVALKGRAYKVWDDSLDALTCAYVAAFVWRYGPSGPEVRTFGNLTDGYIVIPDVPAKRAGGTLQLEVLPNNA